eukprot:scaffold12297_cov96-Isochrysis_galbana.AAC.3
MALLGGAPAGGILVGEQLLLRLSAPVSAFSAPPMLRSAPPCPGSLAGHWKLPPRTSTAMSPDGTPTGEKKMPSPQGRGCTPHGAGV